MADLSSILGGMVQGFKDFGTGLVDFFGTGAANIGDIASSIATGRATTKNQDDFRKWLYQTDDTQDAAAKGLGTILNGVSTVADVMPGAQAVTANPLFNGLQGAIGGVSDELKMAGKDADWGRAAQRAGVGAASGLASAYAGQGLAKTGNKLLSNGLTRGAVSGALGGGIANAGYTGIEGGSVQDMINAGLYGAQTGALVGGTTGLARELIKPTHKMDVALTDDEKAARIKNAQEQIDDLKWQIMNASPDDTDFDLRAANSRISELRNAIEGYQAPTEPTKAKTVADLMNEPKQKTVADLMLSPEQEEFFKGSKLRDENGKLMRVYHSSPNKFTTFDDSKLGKNTAYTNTAFGHFVTPDADFSSRFMDIDNKGAKGNMMELYANVKKPITHPYNAGYKYKGADLDNIVENYFKAVDDLEDLNFLKQAAKDNETSLYEAYVDNMDMDSDPFEAAKWDREALMKKGYDAVEMVEGLKSGLVDGSTDNTPVSSYAIFSGNQLKDVNNLRPTADADIMYSKVAEGQLGLFDQPMPTKPVEEALALDGKYSPKDNKVTKAMRARAEEIMGDYKTSKKVPENELYNKIDESTLPNKRKSTGAILDDLYSKGVKPDEVSNKVIDQLVEKEIGGKMDKKSLATYLFGDMDDTTRKDFIKKNLYTTKDYDVDDLTESILKNWARRKAMASGTLNKYNIDNLAIVGGNKTVRQGYTGALDSALSERLGIAPGNTYKQNGEFDTPGALGRYIGSESRPDFNNYMVKEVPDIEEALNTAGHERLHSFQAESRLENRYSKEVADAYNGLASDLKKANAYKSDAEIKNRYKKGTEYWSDTDEQEARMLQQYLGARGFTDYNKRDARMYGALEFDNDKIVPAFDKFFDKLRALSKKGVALPAITALLGGGAIAGALTSGKDDKKKKSEVK